MEEGLSSTYVTAILQDGRGYIWIGTVDGLNKYDGYTFTKYRFDPSDSNSLSQNLIYTIWEDKQGFIWVGTFEGLCKFDRHTEKFTRYKPDPKSKFSDPNISAVNEDINGMMWAGSASGGLCRLDRQTGRFLPDSFDLGFRKSPGSDLHDVINCIYPDKTGALWIGNLTGMHEITFIAAKQGKSPGINIRHYRANPANPDSLSNNNVTAIIEDHSGLLWLGTANGLNSFDRKTGKFKRYLHDPKNANSISTNYLATWFQNGITEDRNGNLWITSGKGLNKLNPDRDSFTAYFNNPNDANSISSNITSTVCVDRAGILWIGCWNGKLDKTNLNQKPFGLVSHDPANANSLSHNEILSVLEDSEGIVWIGTNGGGLNRWDRKTSLFTRFRHNQNNATTLRSDAVYGILEDQHKHLWICNGDVLSRFDKQTGEFSHFNSNALNYQDIDHRFIYSITEDKEGFIWLGTGNGIKKFDESTGAFKHYYHDPADSIGISDYTALAIFADSRDNIWVGFGSIATDRLNKKTDHITHFKHDPKVAGSISSNIVNCFFEDSKGSLWLGTSAGGVCRFDYTTEKFTTFTDKQGLPSNSVYSILEDNKNQLWLATANGLSRFDPLTKSCTNYDYKDGLQSNFFAAGHRDRPGRFKGMDGILYFGGPNGITFFNPAQLTANTNLAPVVITHFKLFDSLVKGANESEEIILNHDQNYFSFEFSSLSYYNPARNQYAYKLEGVDKDWVYSGSRRYAGYTDIGPGKYTFKVKATNNDGVWNEEGTSVLVIIRPPWWRTWWAYSIYALLFVAAIWRIHRYQKQRVIDAERQKAQKRELAQAKEIEKAYHELKTTQQQLIQSEKMASLGELAAGIAHEIQNPLNFVNNFSEVNKELIDEMEQEIDKGNFTDVKTVASNIRENEEKINHHGKKADAIVKSMLQHSRGSSGKKEPVDINALADEYLRLAYHGLKAKDKSFNAKVETDFDNSIGNINIIPQDIGRVILNLINNAFYAVNEKQNDKIRGYEPRVTVSSKKTDGVVQITVADNGNGIPQKLLDKIFQPFFTTKPTGQGTGLGLSLAYDIIKAHGGELKVESEEGKESTFTIQLPLQQ